MLSLVLCTWLLWGKLDATEIELETWLHCCTANQKAEFEGCIGHNLCIQLTNETIVCLVRPRPTSSELMLLDLIWFDDQCIYVNLFCAPLLVAIPQVALLHEHAMNHRSTDGIAVWERWLGTLSGAFEMLYNEMVELRISVLRIGTKICNVCKSSRTYYSLAAAWLNLV